MKKTITIVGAGSAGCLSALFFKELFPLSTVKVIADNNIDIIGVGESTTPPVLKLFNFIKISLEDLISNAGATIKNSIKFTNWNGDGKHFYHGFTTNPSLCITSLNSRSPYSSNSFLDFSSNKTFLAINEILNNNNLDDIHFPAVSSHQNKIPLIQKNSTGILNLDFDQLANYAIHVDAKKLAHYLKEVAQTRDIEFIDDRIIDFKFSESGTIDTLITKTHNEIATDFIVDCSGFVKLFAKQLNINFESFKDYLPVNRALPFFIENTGKTPPYTEAIAMKYGWMWKIPVQGRYGCGYVFDKNLITNEQAHQEAEEIIGHQIIVPKIIDFEPGYLTEPWTKNVLNVGLSTGFIEPLEATSLWIMAESLASIVNYLEGFTHNDQFAIKEYNKNFIQFVKSISSLVNFHYLTKRQDTEFWKNINKETVKLSELKNILSFYENRLPSPLENSLYNSFDYKSWLIVGAGNNYFNQTIVKKEFESYNVNSVLQENVVAFKEKLKNASNECIDHDDFLNYIQKKV